MIDLLLTGGTVVTIDAARRVLTEGAVAIDRGRIVAVGPADEIGRQHQATRTIDCRQPGRLIASAAAATIRVLILFVLLQRYYVRGVLMSGLKG